MTEHLIDRAARYQPCPKCERHTLTAIVGGMPIRADPEPLTINAEIAALLSGLITFDVHSYGLPRKMHLEDRDIDRIKRGHKYPVVAMHTCIPLPRRRAAAPETELTIPYARKQETDAIPF